MVAAAPPVAPDARPDDGIPDVVIRISHLQNSFGEQVVHQDVNLEVHRGEIIGVVGGFGYRQVGPDALDHRPADARWRDDRGVGP